MIKADHKYWARALFNPYINRLLKKHFSNFYLINELPNIEGKKLILTPNHFSWWDGFFVDLLNRKIINRKFHILMLEDQLKRYWFFQKLGAYGFNPDNPKSILEAVKYTNQILSNIDNFSIIYPQGKIYPFEQKPLSIKDGLRYFIKDSDSNLVMLPIAFKVNYEEEKLPSIYCKFGNLLESDAVKKNYQLFIDSFSKNIEELKELSLNNNYKNNLFVL